MTDEAHFDQERELLAELIFLELWTIVIVFLPTISHNTHEPSNYAAVIVIANIRSLVSITNPFGDPYGEGGFLS